jgi:hypothetical protein
VEQKTIASFEEIEQAESTEYDTVDVYGLTLRIGSLSSFDLLKWLEENEKPELRKEAGLRLAVKSLVDRDNKRVPEDKFDQMLERLRRKNAKDNGRLVEACLKLNGLDRATQAALKNALPEARIAASPSGSPDTSAR